MRSCWHEDPDKRLTFRQLHKALNRLDKEIQVRVLNMNVSRGRDRGECTFEISITDKHR